MNAFELASRIKLRFQTPRGPVGVEDLWDLDLPVLDKMAVAIDKAENEGRVTFLSSSPRRTSADKNNGLRLSILKRIIETREQEAEDAKVRRDKAAKRAQLTLLLEKKREESMLSMSEEEILAQLKEFD
jgi:hypothetical protein